MKWLLLVLVVVVGCAYQAPYVIRSPDIFPPPMVEKQPPVVVGKTPSAVVEEPPSRPAWQPSPTQLYGDPSRGYVHNMTINKFVRGWWMLTRPEKKPSQPPDFELAPGFRQEFYLSPPGKHGLYIEGIYFTQRGESSAGWNFFEVEVSSRLNYDGQYGWQVILYEGYFRY